MIAPDPSRPVYHDWLDAETLRKLAQADALAERQRADAEAAAQDAAVLTPEPAPKGWWITPSLIVGPLVWAVILLSFLAAIVAGAAALIERTL